MLECLKLHPPGTVVSLSAQPRASRNQIVGLHGAQLKLKLTSPVDGAANKCYCDSLAKIFNLAKSEARLVAGDRAR